MASDGEARDVLLLKGRRQQRLPGEPRRRHLEFRTDSSDQSECISMPPLPRPSHRRRWRHQRCSSSEEEEEEFRSTPDCGTSCGEEELASESTSELGECKSVGVEKRLRDHFFVPWMEEQ